MDSICSDRNACTLDLTKPGQHHCLCSRELPSFDRRRRTLRKRDDNALDRYSSGANQGGKVHDLHLTATFAFTCLLCPRVSGEEREETRKRKITRRERSICSWVFFSLKDPVGVVQREKKDKEVAEGGSRTVEKPAASS